MSSPKHSFLLLSLVLINLTSTGWENLIAYTLQEKDLQVWNDEESNLNKWGVQGFKNLDQF